VIQPTSWPERCRQRPSGRSPSVRAQIAYSLRFPGLENPQGRRAPNLGGCDLRAIRSLQPGCVSLLLPGLFKTRNRDGSHGWHQWGPLGANDPGRPPVRWPRSAEVVGLAWEITGMAELECDAPRHW